MSFRPKIHEKAWDASVESGIFRGWQEEKVFEFDVASPRELFVIDTPPPYPSGRPWHIGAAAHYSQIDMIARTARMMGYEVLFPIGIDRNGMPVEIYTERTYKLKMHTTPREKFLELCRHALDDLEAEMIGIMKACGLSGDFDNYYRTDDVEYRRLTQATFIELWNRGLIYEATRPNTYCKDCGTTLADADIEYRDVPSKLVYVKFRVVETGEIMEVGTTRPELLCSCQMIIVNPEDDRYHAYHGSHAVVPIYEREVEIVPHPAAKAEFATGAMMICSYGDYTDVQLFRQLGLEEIVAIDTEGRMTEAAGFLRGLSMDEARERMIRELEKRGLADKVDDMTHRIPMCERSETVIEFIPMKEYYLKQIEFLPDVRRLANEIVFHPDSHRQILLDWIGSVSIDWPISRRRYYGTEIPVWYCTECGEPHVPEPGPYYQPWKDDPPFDECRECGERRFVGDVRTFDTWMDSSVSPLFVTRYGRDEELFGRGFPTALRPQAKDIVRTWLYYTILRCYQLTGKAPFKHAWIGGLGLDERGRAMHRHLGNVMDPIPILKRYGADSFRFWSAREASLGYDFRTSESRIAGAGKFLTKLWNVARFVSSFPIRNPESKPAASDRWILAELARLVDECADGYRDFNFFVPSNRIREFTWNLFAAHYAEMVKARAYGRGFSEDEQIAAWHTLHTCLRTILLLLAPIVPFITERIWEQLYGDGSIHGQRFPEATWVKKSAEKTSAIVEFNSEVWKLKKGRGLTLRDSVRVEIPSELEAYSRDLVAMHSLKA
ncbi:MAG: valine--tRNA ligase [Candidatus Geothermarchaeales archaeon]